MSNSTYLEATYVEIYYLDRTTALRAAVMLARRAPATFPGVR